MNKDSLQQEKDRQKDTIRIDYQHHLLSTKDIFPKTRWNFRVRIVNLCHLSFSKISLKIIKRWRLSLIPIFPYPCLFYFTILLLSILFYSICLLFLFFNSIIAYLLKTLNILEMVPMVNSYVSFFYYSLSLLSLFHL